MNLPWLCRARENLKKSTFGLRYHRFIRRSQQVEELLHVLGGDCDGYFEAEAVEFGGGHVVVGLFIHWYCEGKYNVVNFFIYLGTVGKTLLLD